MEIMKSLEMSCLVLKKQGAPQSHSLSRVTCIIPMLMLGDMEPGDLTVSYQPYYPHTVYFSLSAGYL